MKTSTQSVLAALTFVCLAVGPKGQAVSPPPDGGYPGFNTAEGQNALFSLTTGSGNTAVGWYSLFSNAEGSFNTATGAGALIFNTADANTAFGAAALLFNTIGIENTAVGAATLLNNTEGNFNTANGYQALLSNTTGEFNTANGDQALFNNTTGAANTANGYQALFSNATGAANTATGRRALPVNTTGNDNTASGSQALFNNTIGNRNTATGLSALGNNSAGNLNTATGYLAGQSITGDGNVCIGADVSGVAGENNTTWIRNIYGTIQPVVGTDPDNVTVNSSGRLGRANVSSRRYKHDIQPMDKASEALYALKPVTFRYHKEYDATQTLAFGLIAEQVAEVYPDLVGRNPDGKPESVRYEQINAMLLNEFLKEHTALVEEQHKVERLEATVASLVATMKEQATQIQKVNARLQLSESAPVTAANDP